MQLVPEKAFGAQTAEQQPITSAHMPAAAYIPSAFIIKTMCI